MSVQVHFKLPGEMVQERGRKDTKPDPDCFNFILQILKSGEVDARFATAQLHSETCSQLNPAASFFH